MVYGPKRYTDDKWQVELITLDYNGQEIDLSGSDSMMISNKERTAWIPLLAYFDRALEMDVCGISVKVIHPLDFIAYKSELDGQHQQEDIEAAQKFLEKKKAHFHAPLSAWRRCSLVGVRIPECIRIREIGLLDPIGKGLRPPDLVAGPRVVVRGRGDVLGFRDVCFEPLSGVSLPATPAEDSIAFVYCRQGGNAE